MTRLKYALSALLLVTSSLSFAEDEAYDPWTCREGSKLKLTALQCVSCGIQTYFSEKAPNREVVPSERWMVLLGLTARQTANLGDRKSSSEDIQRNQRIRVIAQIQRYGFCTSYGENRKGPRKNPNWRDYVFNYTNRGNVNDTKLVTIAESFGFSDKGWGNHADENLRYLINNQGKNVSDYKSDEEVPPDFADQSFVERRESFQKRLKNALQSGYDVSGEKTNTKPIISSSEDGDDLRVCLEQIDQMQSGKGDPLLNSFLQSNTENIKFCNSMASACGIEDTSFCGQVKESTPAKPAAPTPSTKRVAPPLPPPPSRSGGGVK